MGCLWLLNSSVESCSVDLSSRSDSGIGAQPPRWETQTTLSEPGRKNLPRHAASAAEKSVPIKHITNDVTTEFKSGPERIILLYVSLW